MQLRSRSGMGCARDGIGKITAGDSCEGRRPRRCVRERGERWSRAADRIAAPNLSPTGAEIRSPIRASASWTATGQLAEPGLAGVLRQHLCVPGGEASSAGVGLCQLRRAAEPDPTRRAPGVVDSLALDEEARRADRPPPERPRAEGPARPSAGGSPVAASAMAPATHQQQHEARRRVGRRLQARKASCARRRYSPKPGPKRRPRRSCAARNRSEKTTSPSATAIGF